MVVRRNTYLNVCICPCTCEHTYPLNMCAQVQTCLHTQTHLHTIAHPHISICETAHMYTDGIHSHAHMLAYRTMITGLKAFTCASAHSVHRCTGSPLLSMLSNHEFTGRPLVSSTIVLAQLPPPGSPSPSLMTGSSCSCNPNSCLGFPPPGGPQIPD